MEQPLPGRLAVSMADEFFKKGAGRSMNWHLNLPSGNATFHLPWQVIWAHFRGTRKYNPPIYLEEESWHVFEQ